MFSLKYHLYQFSRFSRSSLLIAVIIIISYTVSIIPIMISHIQMTIANNRCHDYFEETFKLDISNFLSCRIQRPTYHT